jgi:hypothetical protein
VRSIEELIEKFVLARKEGSAKLRLAPRIIVSRELKLVPSRL